MSISQRQLERIGKSGTILPFVPVVESIVYRDPLMRAELRRHSALVARVIPADGTRHQWRGGWRDPRLEGVER